MNRIEITRAQYDSLAFKSNNTTYIISDEQGTIYKGSTLINKNWVKYTPPQELCFTANTAGSTVELIKVGSPSITNTAYSRDGIDWIPFTPSTTQGTNVVTLTSVGDKVYFRNDITGDFTTEDKLRFKLSGSIAASGNCNSMYSATNFMSLTALTYKYCFTWLFNSQPALTSVPNLPATTLSQNCYNSMFAGCTSLTSIPADLLPASTLSDACYMGMFMSCTGIISVPSNLLPAKTLAMGCYGVMFNGCTSLTQAPELPATTLDSSSYMMMFYGCSSLQVNDSPVSGIAEQVWRIPTTGVFTNTSIQYSTFAGCAGTRSSDNMPGEAGQSYTYYTQNTPSIKGE